MNRIDIMNMALGMLGVERIESDGDGTKQAGLCKDFYDLCVKELISSVDINACRFVDMPNADLDHQEECGKLRYFLPKNYIRPVRNHNKYRFEISGGYLHVNEAAKYNGFFVYYGIINEGDFPVLMIRAVATLLASYLTVPLSNSLDKKNHYRNEFKRDIVPELRKLERMTNPQFADDLSETLGVGSGRGRGLIRI